MRFLLAAAAVALGCGGGSTVKGAKSANIPAAARSYTAARWIPGKPTYAFAARTVRDLQRSAKDVIESFGIIGDVELSVIGSALSEAIGVDPLSPEAVSAIGV